MLTLHQRLDPRASPLPHGPEIEHGGASGSEAEGRSGYRSDPGERKVKKTTSFSKDAPVHLSESHDTLAKLTRRPKAVKKMVCECVGAWVCLSEMIGGERKVRPEHWFGFRSGDD